MAAGFGRRKGKYTAHGMPIRQEKKISLRSSDEKLNRAVMRRIVVATRGFDMACLM